MFKRLKIDIAILICFPFIIGLLMFHTAVGSNAVQSNKVLSLRTENVSIEKNTYQHFEPGNHSSDPEFVAVEICEEDSDEDHLFKLNLLLAAQNLYSSLVSRVSDSTQNNLVFISNVTSVDSDRYLKLQVIRI